MHHLLIYSADHDRRVPPFLSGALTPVAVKRYQDVAAATLAPWWNADEGRYNFNTPLRFISREKAINLDFYPAADGFLASERLLKIIFQHAPDCIRVQAVEILREGGQPNSTRPMMFCQVIERQPVCDYDAIADDKTHHPELDGRNLIDEQNGRVMVLRAMNVLLRQPLPGFVEAYDLPHPAMLVSDDLKEALLDADCLGVRFISVDDIAVVDFWPNGPGDYNDRPPLWKEHQGLAIWSRLNGPPVRARFGSAAKSASDPVIATLLAEVAERQARTPASAGWRDHAAVRYPEIDQDDLSSAMSFWMALRAIFERAVKHDDDAKAAMILLDARDWLNQGARAPNAGDDPYTAVVVGFLEGLLGVRGADRHLLATHSREELLEMKPFLSEGLFNGRRYVALLAQTPISER